MGRHIDCDGRFQSDKFNVAPDKVLLSFSDPAAQEALKILAEDYRDLDPEFSEDILTRLQTINE